MTSIHVLLVCFASWALPLVSQNPSETCCGTIATECADEAPALDRIKALAGTWVRVGEDGKPTEEIISKYRLTAGGSAVIETLFPGTDHEMISLYHMDGADLVMTHYCVLGNQPHMIARSISADEIVFVCDCTGISSKEEAHMHQGTIQWVGKDHLKTEYLQHTDGEVTYTAAFDVVRR